MTYPEIGNTGVNREDVESSRPYVEGFIVKEYWASPSNWRSTQSLGDYLAAHGIPGIQGIDTRKLVRHLRDRGNLNGVLSTRDLDPDRLVRRAREAPSMEGQDLVQRVTTAAPYDWHEGAWTLDRGYVAPQEPPRHFVVAYDFGIKRNILRNLVQAGCRVRVVPAGTPAAGVLAMRPDGVFLSNGPGDPAAAPYAAEAVRGLLGKTPIFGICLGHQILGLALGGTTYKLKFGHHGGNQPVMDLTTGKVEITSQNHGFAVDVDSLGGRAELTHVNLNDQTVEGLSHKTLPLFSVQYHPESSPGPHDANYLFRRFVELMESGR
jgi:carbamoyl-phosphate synthase small subunit